MEILKGLLLLTFIHSMSCHTKRGIVETSYHPSFHNLKLRAIQYYNQEGPDYNDPATAHSSKQNPVIVSLQPPASLSTYHANQQFQTYGQPIEFTQATVQVPYNVPPNPYQQGFYNNQYNVNQPLYIPYQQYQQLNTQLNNNVGKIRIPNKIQPLANNPTPRVQPAPKVSAPLRSTNFQHQIYHPHHSKILQGPQTFKKPQNYQVPVLPTPPKIYRNFRPMIVNTPAPVPAPVHENEQIKKPEQEESEEDSKEDSKEEVNEESEENEELNEEEDNEKVEDEDHEDQREETSAEDDYRPERLYASNFEDDYGRYRHKESDEDEEQGDRYSESRQKVSSRYKYPKDFKNPTYKKFVMPYTPTSEFERFMRSKEHDPNVKIKMYKYTKSSEKPAKMEYTAKMEYIQGKGSENIPVFHRSKKSYKEQWVISSKSTNMSEEK